MRARTHPSGPGFAGMALKMHDACPLTGPCAVGILAGRLLAGGSGFNRMTDRDPGPRFLRVPVASVEESTA